MKEGHRGRERHARRRRRRRPVNRPDKLNALNNETLVEAHEGGREGPRSEDSGVGVVILTGRGEKAFIAGADLGPRPRGARRRGGPKQNSILGQTGLTLAIETSRKPWLAAINGYALGGGLEMALACDVRFFARTRPSSACPRSRSASYPGYGGTQRLPRPRRRRDVASQLVLTGDPIGAEDALRIGLVNDGLPAGGAHGEHKEGRD